MLPTVSATLDDLTRVSDVLYVPPGKRVDVSASTSDLDDGTLLLEVSDNGNTYRAAHDARGLVIHIEGDGGAESSSAQLANETTGPMFLRWRLVPLDDVTPIVGDVAVLMKSPYSPALDLSDLPEYADNTAALAAGEAIGAAYADATGAIFRVIEE